MINLMDFQVPVYEGDVYICTGFQLYIYSSNIFNLSIQL